jgi:ATP-dependent Clp protease ATP-binding subunit ClpB
LRKSIVFNEYAFDLKEWIFMNELLKKEATKKRLEDIQAELNELIGRQTVLVKQWKVEKKYIQEIKTIKEKIEEKKRDAEKFESAGDLGKVAEIRYSDLIELERDLEEVKTKLNEVQQNSTLLKQEVDAEDIAEVAAKWTKIPVSKMMETERMKLVNMEERLHKRVISQNEAVSAVANAIRRSRAGLQDENRPIGSFVFLGTTGVGKTEMARALAEFLFDDESAVIRFDMSEYMEKHSVSRLIGAPPGYVGYEQGGQLTEAVKNSPYSVVLFDEIEKANPEIFNVLLQVLDDGRLSDGKGKTINFKNTIIIMTSNLGSDIIQEKMQTLDSNSQNLDLEEVKEAVMLKLKKTLRPEFVNRIDELVFFEPLFGKDIIKIADLQIERLRQRLKNKHINLYVSDEAKLLIARKGFDIIYGARPLKRVIQKLLIDRISMDILKGDFISGDAIYIDVDNENQFTFTKNKLSII